MVAIINYVSVVGNQRFLYLSVYLPLLYDKKIFQHSNKPVCHFYAKLYHVLNAVKLPLLLDTMLESSIIVLCFSSSYSILHLSYIG